MSTRKGSMGERRRALLQQLAEAGRTMSDAAVMFHTALGEKLGLGPSDWKTLGLLERHGALSAGELSEKSGLAPASVTGILDRLEHAGWIRRSRDPQDARRVVVRLDKAAAAVQFAPFFHALSQRLHELYARYSDDDLELLVEFITELASRQKEATGELTKMPTTRRSDRAPRGGR